MFDVLGTDFTKLGTVENPSSANYSVYWQETGGITLIAAATPNNQAWLKNDRYILVKAPVRRGMVNDTAYVIVNVAVDEEKAEITVNGKTADYMLHGRAMQPVVLEGTRAREAVSKTISDNLRGLPIVTGITGEMVDTEIIRYPMDGGALDETTMELMQYCGIGKQLYFDLDRFVFLADSGRVRTGLAHVPVFGRGSGIARNPTIAIDSSDYCNVATATLSFNDDHTEEFAVGTTDSAGIDRLELWCGEISQDSEETDADFRARAQAEMEGMLEAHVKRISVSADIDADDLSAHYQLGDIVPVKIGGYLVAKRITGIVWLTDQMNDKATLQLGDPVMTVIAEIKEKSKAESKRVSGSIGGLSSRAKAAEKKISAILEDYKLLVAKVDGVVAGMDAYVLNKTFEDYKYAVSRLFASIEEANAALKLSVEKNTDDIGTLAQAQSSLVAQVDGAEARIDLNAQNINGVASSVASIEADVINLKGRVNLTDVAYVSEGHGLGVVGSIVANGNILANGYIGTADGGGYVLIGSKAFVPTEITSTSGTVLVLGIA